MGICLGVVVMNNLALQEPWLNDTAADEAANLEAARDEARKEIINTILADEPVYFATKDKWTQEEILENYLVIPDAKLDKYIEYQKEP